MGWPWFLQLVDLIQQVAPYLAVLHILLLLGAIVAEGFAVAGRRMQIGLALVSAVALIGVLPAAVALAIPALNALGVVLFFVAVLAFGAFVGSALVD